MCDQLSDAILDAHLEEDCNAKVACGRWSVQFICIATTLYCGTWKCHEMRHFRHTSVQTSWFTDIMRTSLTAVQLYLSDICIINICIVRVKIKGVLRGRGVMASDSEPGNFYRLTPPNPHGIKISTPTDPLGKRTETFKMTNKIAFIIISKSAKSLQTH